MEEESKKVKELKDMYYDGYLHKIMEQWKERIKKDWDFLIAIDGREGSGKSVFAQQVALFLDPTFCLERIVFTNEQFMDAVKEAKKYQAIVFDEAFCALSTREAIQGRNRVLMKALREIRRRNLFMIVVQPSFFDFTKYVALHRSIALFHIKTDDDYNRGFFTAYNFDRKSELYMKGQKFYTYEHTKPNFFGRFCQGWAVNPKLYDMKKAQSTDEEEEKDDSLHTKELQRNKALLALSKFMDTHDEIAQATGMSRRNVSKILKNFTSGKLDINVPRAEFQK